jgi:hypothetical protein
MGNGEVGDAYLVGFLSMQCALLEDEVKSLKVYLAGSKAEVESTAARVKAA